MFDRHHGPQADTARSPFQLKPLSGITNTTMDSADSGIQTKRSGASPASISHLAFRILQSHPLILLTLFAGIIRFTLLSQPCLWYDESMVFWRTCGSYGQLLDCLRTDGFVPLHYSLIWLMLHWPQIMPEFVAHAFKLSPDQFVARCAWLTRPTPFLLRFIPALTGTLMVPAVYSFAVQLLPRKTALLAAALAACSGFAIHYSRDAKMYMDSWLFVTMNLACLLWWFRNRTTTAWLCWVACGSIACGLQITSAIYVAVSLLLLLTQGKPHWKMIVGWMAGVCLIAAGPIGHYEKFNTWVQRSNENWNDSGLQWISAYNAGRDGPQHVRYLATMLGMGWEWPRPDDIARLPGSRFAVPSTYAAMLLAFLCLGFLPRLKGRRSFLAAEKVPMHSVLGTATGSQPQWRVLLWLGILIVLPVYAFYCRSAQDFAGPMQWWQWLRGQSQQIHSIWWFWSLLAIPVLAQLTEPFFFLRFRPALREVGDRLLRGLMVILVAAAIIGMCWGIHRAMLADQKSAMAAGKGWQSLWVPRYLGFVFPALMTAMAALLMRLPTRPLRTAAIVFVLGINLAVGALRIFAQTEPPVDRMAADDLTAADSSMHTLTRMDIDRGALYPGGGTLFGGPGEYYLDLLGNVTTTPDAFQQSIQRRQNSERVPPFFRRLRSIPANINHVIVWNQFNFSSMYSPGTFGRFRPHDEIVARERGWHLVDEQEFITRDCWVWEDLAMYRRREYARD